MAKVCGHKTSCSSIGNGTMGGGCEVTGVAGTNEADVFEGVTGR